MKMKKWKKFVKFEFSIYANNEWMNEWMNEYSNTLGLCRKTLYESR